MEPPAYISGYERTWSIKENKLYLVNLKIHLEKSCAEDTEDGLIFADWFTGNVNFGKSDKMPIGMHYRYEKYLSLRFKNGVLAEELVLTCGQAYPSEPEELCHDTTIF